MNAAPTLPARHREPAFASLALRDIPSPDYAETQLIPLPPGATTSPREWAVAIFDVNASPAWVRALMGLRQALVGLVGIERGDEHTFDVAHVEGDEALICADESHLDFRAAVRVDAAAELVRVTTVVRLHGWRGRLYFLPVRLLHSPICFAMMRRAARSLTA